MSVAIQRSAQQRWRFPARFRVIRLLLLRATVRKFTTPVKFGNRLCGKFVHCLIARRGFADGTRASLQVVTDGMKLTPINPNMLQERDGIIAGGISITGGTKI